MLPLPNYFLAHPAGVGDKYRQDWLSHGSLGIFWQKKIDFRNVHYQVLQGNKNEHVKGSLPVSTKIFIMAKLFGMSCTPNQFFSIPNEEYRD